jgi:hypothetical protein
MIGVFDSSAVESTGGMAGVFIEGEFESGRAGSAARMIGRVESSSAGWMIGRVRVPRRWRLWNEGGAHPAAAPAAVAAKCGRGAARPGRRYRPQIDEPVGVLDSFDSFDPFDPSFPIVTPQGS